ncbi:MAG: transketolase [Oscillospiraceae bacterium]|nr:transketolase [Oscillospiraceae bacterium]
MMDSEIVSELEAKCREIRYLIVDTIGTVGSGHVGGSLSAVEALVTLYYRHLRADPSQPDKPGRDRFVLSKGHCGPVLYSILADRGYFDREWLHTMNRLGTRLPSHVDRLRTPGVDMTAGSLGQGLSCAVGIAIGSRLAGDGAYTYAMIGDGESEEGQIWEAAMFAAHEKLERLIVFTDYNGEQIDGYVDQLSALAPLGDKWRAFGWFVQEIDGHDIRAIDAALEAAKSHRGSPSMILLRTWKGRGYSRAEQTPIGNHSMSFTPEQHAAALEELKGGLMK